MIIGPIKITNCAHDDFSKCTISSKCQISGSMLMLNESIKNLFDKITIEDLIHGEHQKETSGKCK